MKINISSISKIWHIILTEIIIEERNIPSTSSSINSEFVRLNKPSYSSSNYVANVDSDKTPLLVYIDSTTRYTKVWIIYN